MITGLRRLPTRRWRLRALLDDTKGNDIGADGQFLDNSTYRGMGGETTKGQLDGAIQQLKSQIDSMSNTQQMDMLRLQSLSNKRNEAFEIMTNFVKKNNDNRASIVGNMCAKAAQGLRVRFGALRGPFHTALHAASSCFCPPPLFDPTQP